MADFPSDPSSVMLLKERSSQVSEVMLSIATELVVRHVNKPDDNLVLLKVSQNLPQARERLYAAVGQSEVLCSVSVISKMISWTESLQHQHHSPHILLGEELNVLRLLVEVGNGGERQIKYRDHFQNFKC